MLHSCQPIKLRSLNRFQSSPSLSLSFSHLWRLRSKNKKTKIQATMAAAIIAAFPRHKLHHHTAYTAQCRSVASCSNAVASQHYKLQERYKLQQRAAASQRCELQNVASCNSASQRRSIASCNNATTSYNNDATSSISTTALQRHCCVML